MSPLINLVNLLTPKPVRLSILLCLLPDDFTRQWGTPGSQWVNLSYFDFFANNQTERFLILKYPRSLDLSSPPLGEQHSLVQIIK